MFQDLKIIELASVLAGPSVGQFFAELGAEVIKVENPEAGDVTRSWKLQNEDPENDRSAYFCSVNWGKKTVKLNLKAQTDRNKLYKLVNKADIIIASYKPGDAINLGVDYNSLKKIKPEIIYGKITGFGEEIDRVGYDAIIQAESGFMSINGEKGGGPLKLPIALMDVLAGHHLKEALLLSIIHKLKTGEGSEVEVNLAQAAISSLVNQATNFLVGGVIPQRMGSAHPNIAPYGDIFHSADNIPFVLAIGSDKQFENLCHILKTDIFKKGAFSKNYQRVKNRSALKGELNVLVKDWLFNDLEEHFLHFHVPYGRIRNIKEALATPFAQEMILKDQGIMSVRLIAFKLSFSKPVFPKAPPKFK